MKGEVLNGKYCFCCHTTHGIEKNKDIIYTFENGKEIYYTTAMDNHKKKMYMDRIWDKSFTDQLIEVD